uniref:C-type lectin domain-containing protein n=1 Tax=Accipiter nisus TaxID=211598 RepID=A0A8B9LZ89_9AVES
SPVSAVWEVLEQAQIRSANSHTTAWHNLSEVQRALGMTPRPTTAPWHPLDGLEPVLRQLAEVKQEQSRVSALIDTALEETPCGRLPALAYAFSVFFFSHHFPSEIICTRCPAGWQQFDKTCYFFSSTTKPWLGAKEFCANFNSHLAIVNTEQENKFLANHIMDNRVFWLGLTDMHTEGNWQWVDGSILSLAFWNSGEPNNVGHEGEDCATIYSSGRWNDATCSNAETWVCERSC